MRWRRARPCTIRPATPEPPARVITVIGLQGEPQAVASQRPHRVLIRLESGTVIEMAATYLPQPGPIGGSGEHREVRRGAFAAPSLEGLPTL
jgi:hypothetical protein